MVTSLAIEPVSSGTTNLMDHRYRPIKGERTVLHDSAQKSPTGAKAGDRDRSLPHEKRREDDQQPPEPLRDRAADFAAAIIAGALPPTPTSMEELIRRIGSIEIPEESQARLRDLLA